MQSYKTNTAYEVDLNCTNRGMVDDHQHLCLGKSETEGVDILDEPSHGGQVNYFALLGQVLDHHAFNVFLPFPLRIGDRQQMPHLCVGEETVIRVQH